jgi:hypothetical protein
MKPEGSLSSSHEIKISIQNYNYTCSLVSNTERRAYIVESVLEQGAKNNMDVRDRTWQEDREYYTVKSSIICTLFNEYY